MCGRFAFFSLTPEDLTAFGVVPGDIGLKPRYNIAPTQQAVVVPNLEPRRLESFRWGLLPGWAKDLKIGSRLINARAETLSEKPSFREAYRKRRCLVPADGFFEWKDTGDGKVPYFVRLKTERPFALAGLWESYQQKGESPLLTFTIITTRPNELLSPIHQRMPVILPVAAYDRWLDPHQVSSEDLGQLLVPYSAREMTAYPVSARVNSPSNDDQDVIRIVLEEDLR
jgi:putative SOS response-associated peptidase YedK